MSHTSENTSVQVQRALEGDHRSLNWVVLRLSPLLEAQVTWRLSATPLSAQDAPDVVAEAWMVLLRRRGDLIRGQGRATPRVLAFLTRTTLNLINRRLDAYLRHGTLELPRGRGSWPATNQAQELADTASDALTQIVRNEHRRVILKALDGLGEKDRACVILRGIERLGNGAAAQELGELPNTLSQRYRRALRKLSVLIPRDLIEDLKDA